MSVDWLEIVVGLRAALQGLVVALEVVLEGFLRATASWGLVLVGIFCGAWMVQLLERLMQFTLFGWLRALRWLWRFGLSGHCVFPGCRTRIRARYQLCRNHFLAASRYGWEHRDSWRGKDAGSDAFYAYVLELDGGQSLYAGQTRNPMRRLHEHLNGGTRTTAGRHPRLAWFEQLPTRQAAVEKEADLKHRIDTDPQAVWLMIEAFRRR